MGRSLGSTAASALAVVGLVFMSSAAAASPGGSYTVSGNGGFVSVSALDLFGLTGAGSSVGATNNGVHASGTGLCATDAAGTAATCQEASSPVTATTANAAATPAAPSATAGPTCLAPTPAVPLVTLAVACGTASATQDPTGAQTAKGSGSLGRLTIDLGSLVAPSTLASLPLCGSAGSPGAALTSSVGGLLSSVDSLLSSSGLPALTSSATSPLTSVCDVLGGLTSELGGLGGVLSDLTSSTDLVTVKPGQATSTITTAPSASGDAFETVTVTTQGVEVDVLGLLDLQLSPNTASITLDTTTGAVSRPEATTGALRVTPTGAAGTNLSVPDLSGILSTLLGALGVSWPVDPSLATMAQSTTTVAPDGHSGSADAAGLNLDLLNGMLELSMGGAEVAAADAGQLPVTSAVVTPTPAPPVVPGVTSVHTGEFWAGPLPLVLAPAMALTGLLLIGRRRVRAAARALRHLPHQRVR